MTWVNTELGLKGANAIAPSNLSEWRSGGFAEWMDKQDEVERVKSLTEFAVRLTTSAGGSLADSAVAIAGGQLLQVLEAFDPEIQKDLIKEDPKNYLELLGKLAGIQRAEADGKSIKQNEIKLQQADRKLALEEARFQRQTAELFLKYCEDKKAKDIAEGRASRDVKIEQLKLLMFGRAPDEKS